jgi:hypothetical protein
VRGTVRATDRSFVIPDAGGAPDLRKTASGRRAADTGSASALEAFLVSGAGSDLAAVTGASVSATGWA